MTIDEYKKLVKTEGRIEAGSDAHLLMHQMSQDALRITMEMNNKYHTHDELAALMSELTGTTIDPSFRIFSPFYTDCGKNTTIGKTCLSMQAASFKTKAESQSATAC